MDIRRTLRDLPPVIALLVVILLGTLGFEMGGCAPKLSRPGGMGPGAAPPMDPGAPLPTPVPIPSTTQPPAH